MHEVRVSVSSSVRVEEVKVGQGTLMCTLRDVMAVRQSRDSGSVRVEEVKVGQGTLMCTLWERVVMYA